MRGPGFLLEQVGRIRSKMGGFVPGSHVLVRGTNLHEGFRDAEWIDLYCFEITGRRLSQNQLRMIQTMWTFTSYPDARVWNNRVAALAGATRSPGNLGVAAALAVSEAEIYGSGVEIRSFDFLLRARRALLSGDATLDQVVRTELKLRRSIGGFGRPITSADERLKPTLDAANRLGLDRGPHLELAREIDRFLVDNRYRIRINYVGITAALLADMGFSSREYYFVAFPAFMAGMAPCYIEAAGKPEQSLFPTPCSNVAYDGQRPRSWLIR